MPPPATAGPQPPADAPQHCIRLAESLPGQVHALLHESGGPLAELLDRSRRALAAGPVCWQVSITPHNVHCIEALLLLAERTGCSVQLDCASGLDARERAFLEDVRAHYPGNAATTGAAAAGARLRGLAELARQYLQVLLRMLPAALRRRRDVSGRQFRHATLTGGFGCEHIGDIASLGGVLLRLARQFGTREACLLSHDPAYSRGLAAQLDTPVTLAVPAMAADSLKRELRATEVLAWAGGQFTDRPLHLLRQLAAVYSVRARGRPVLLEGAAVAQLSRSASRWAIQHIAATASRIRINSSAMPEDARLPGRMTGADRDPAFDYLATRGGLDRLAERDRERIDALLEDTAGRILVGINLRPVPQPRDREDARYMRFMAERLLQHLAVAVTDYERLAPAPVTYVYFPVNLRQAGGSDLAMAWRFNRLLHQELDLRVWQADPDIDAVLYLLRRMDMVLAMRFHACLFAMSQQVPTIGIDYHTGPGGRVTQLFRDNRRVEDFRRLDEVDIHFMVERLLMNQPGGNNHPELYP